MRTSVEPRICLIGALWLAACGGETPGGTVASSSVNPTSTAPGESNPPHVDPAVGPAASTGTNSADPTGTSGPTGPSNTTVAPTAVGPVSVPVTTSETGASVAPTATSSNPGTRTSGEESSTSDVNPGPLVRPSLVTSGPGAYWTVGAVTEMAQATPDLTVDVSTEHQQWLGFGGSFNEQGWDALNVASPEDKQRAITLLFDKAEGAAFEFGRVPIGASDYAIERYTLNDTPEDFTMDNFSIEHDRALLIPFIKAALEVNPNVRLWASPWTPPAWMKSNDKLDGTSKRVDGSTIDDKPDAQMKSDPAILDAFALYLAKFVEEYALEGITIESIMPQNEPGYATRYPSCLWTASVMGTFVGGHLGPLFAERGIGAEIWFGTMSNADAGKDGDMLTAIAADATAMNYIKGFGLQWNMISYVDDLMGKSLPILQTEHKCGNYPFTVEGAPPFNPDQPPNDHAYGEESYRLIRDWLVAGVNSYSAWNMVLDKQGKNLDFDRPWPQNALLVVDRDTGALTVTAAYYVFRHFSYFVDPGAKRVATGGTGDAIAFSNPDGSVVAVVYNEGDAPKPTTLGIGDTRLQFEVPAHGWATVNWQ